MNIDENYLIMMMSNYWCVDNNKECRDKTLDFLREYFSDSVISLNFPDLLNDELWEGDMDG